MATTAMIVDDAPFMRNMLKDFFAGAADIEVVGEAANGQEALENLRILQPQLILLDAAMPFGNSVDLVYRMLRELPSVAIVLVVAPGDEGVVVEAMEAGARDFLVKPFKEQDVLRLARSLF